MSSMTSAALLSENGVYRYRLSRQWNDGRVLLWIMLNPSTADANQDDPTIRRCIHFARAWGFGSIVVVNVFALRATDPGDLLKAWDPIGEKNDEHVLHELRAADLVVAGWGSELERRAHRKRREQLVAILKTSGVEVWCLGRTLGGEPRHPLYVKGTKQLEAYLP